MAIKLTLNRTPVRIDGESVANSVVAKLDQVGTRAQKHLVEVMRKGAEEIKELARDYAPYAPVELGGSPDQRRHLQEAIKVGEDRSGTNRRTSVFVYVDGAMQGAGNVYIDDYAWKMHESLSPYGSGLWHAREGTIAKGPYAGGQYLARAFKDQYKLIIRMAETYARKEFSK